MNAHALSLALQATLTVAVVLVAPALGRDRFLKLAAAIGADRGALRRAYLRTMATQWIFALIAIGAVREGGGSLADLGVRALRLGDSAQLQLPDAGSLGLALTVGGAFGIILGVLRTRTAKGRDQLRRALIPARPLLPQTFAERALWACVALTAGFCEELIFRGMMPRFLGRQLGDPLAGMLLAVLAFGAAHLYQGARGVIGTTVLGAYFAFVVLCTHSIWPAVLLHSLVDLRVLAFPSLDPAPPRE